MRIRQRKKTFPLSSFSPVTLSDPSPISGSSVAIVQLNDDAMPLKPSTPEPPRLAFSDHRQLDRKLPPIGFDSTDDSGVQIQAWNKEGDCLVSEIISTNRFLVLTYIIKFLPLSVCLLNFIHYVRLLGEVQFCLIRYKGLEHSKFMSFFFFSLQ